MASTKVRYDDMNMKQVLEGVDGIICIGKFEKKYLDTFSKLSSRIVFLDMDLSPITNVCISLDFDDAMCKVVNYFHSQGHETIGFMGRNEYDEMSLQTISRKKSFIKYCEYLGIKYEIFTTNHEMTGDEGYSVMNRVIEEGKIPSAIFCANDPLAMGAMQAILDAGITVQVEVSIMRFNVYAPSSEMGEMGASLLHGMITEEDISYPRRIQLPCQLVIRNSCREK